MPGLSVSVCLPHRIITSSHQTVRQLSAVGCRTLWFDHGPHPDHQHHQHHQHQHQHQHQNQNQHYPALEDQDSGGAGGRPEIPSVDLSEEDHSSENAAESLADKLARSRAGSRLPSSQTAQEEETPLPGGGGGGDDGGDRQTGAEASGDIDVDLLNGRRSLMFLDVEEEIGAAGMIGSFEWLLR